MAFLAVSCCFLAGKVPKKLKDVKINPAVAATFANLSVTPASSTNSLGGWAQQRMWE